MHVEGRAALNVYTLLNQDGEILYKGDRWADACMYFVESMKGANQLTLTEYGAHGEVRILAEWTAKKL